MAEVPNPNTTPDGCQVSQWNYRYMVLSSDALGKSKFWFQGGKLTVESSSGGESGTAVC